MSDNLFRFGAAVREYRKARGLTLKEVADAIGASESAVSLWERGRHLPSAPDIRKIAKALGVRPENWLLLTGYIDEDGQWTDPDPQPPNPLADMRLALLAGGWAQETRLALLTLAEATQPTARA